MFANMRVCVPVHISTLYDLLKLNKSNGLFTSTTFFSCRFVYLQTVTTIEVVLVRQPK